MVYSTVNVRKFNGTQSSSPLDSQLVTLESRQVGSGFGFLDDWGVKEP